MCEVKAVIAKHGGITKDRKAPDQIGGYAFRGIEDCDDVLSGLTAQYGLMLYPRVVDCQAETQVDAKGRTQRHVSLTLELDIVSMKDGSMRVIRTFGEGIDTGDKATGKAYSNARKMALLGVFMIPTHGENVEQYPTEVAPAAPPAATKLGLAKAKPRKEEPFPNGTAPNPRGGSVADFIKDLNQIHTFPALYAALQDGHQAFGPNIMMAVGERASALFASAQTMAAVKEGVSLVEALGKPTELMAACNAAYARSRNATPT